MPEILAFHHLSLSVTDLGRSTKWYQQLLGLEVVAELEGKGFRRNRLRSPTSGLTITLTVHDQRASDIFDERRPGMDHVALLVGAGEVEDLKRQFEALGVVHSEIKTTAAGAAMITLRDPDNIQIEVLGEPQPSDPAG